MQWHYGKCDPLTSHNRRNIHQFHFGPNILRTADKQFHNLRAHLELNSLLIRNHFGCFGLQNVQKVKLTELMD